MSPGGGVTLNQVMEKRNLLIVDGNAAFRELLVRFIEESRGDFCVYQASSVCVAIEFIDRLLPEVVILDWTLKNESPIDLLAYLGKCKPKPKVLVLSALCSEQLLKLVLEYGVGVVVEKSATLDEINWAINAAVGGQSYFSAATADTLKRLVTRPSMQDGRMGLTFRERQILLHIANGKRSKDIAVILNVSLSTVNNCRARIGRKSGLKSTAELTRLAYDLGLIAPAG